MDLDVYVSWTWTNGARCGDRRGTWRVRRAVKPRWRGRVLFLGGQHIHAVLPGAMTSQRREKQPDSGGQSPWRGGGMLQHVPSDLAKPPETWQTLIATTSVLVSINLATVSSRHQTLAAETRTRDSEHDCSTATVQPDHWQLNVSITESLMSNVCCTSNY